MTLTAKQKKGIIIGSCVFAGILVIGIILLVLFLSGTFGVSVDRLPVSYDRLGELDLLVPVPAEETLEEYLPGYDGVDVYPAYRGGKVATNLAIERGDCPCAGVFFSGVGVYVSIESLSENILFDALRHEIERAEKTDMTCSLGDIYYVETNTGSSVWYAEKDGVRYSVSVSDDSFTKEKVEKLFTNCLALSA